MKPRRDPAVYVRVGSEPWVEARATAMVRERCPYFLLLSGADLEALVTGTVPKAVREEAAAALEFLLVTTDVDQTR
jgi:hypothetical protein